MSAGATAPGRPEWSKAAPRAFALDDEVALVTGGSRGIGLAIGWALASCGAHVVLCARDAAATERQAEAFRAAGLRASAAAFDVTDGAAIQAAVDGVMQDHGRLDIAIGNAGQSRRGPVTGFTDTDIAGLLQVNLGSALMLARAVTPGMRAAGGGRLLFTGSMLGQVARPNNALYAATKAGLAGLVRALAVELGPSGITCNAIAPGLIATEMTASLVADEAMAAFVRSRTPLGRWGSPEDVALAAVFLVSGASRFITGQVLLADGGMSVSA